MDSEDSEPMEISSRTKKLPVPQKPKRRKSIHGSTSKQDTRTDTTLTSPASSRITNADKKETSFNETGEKWQSTRMEDKQEDNDNEHGNDLNCVEEVENNQQFRGSVERETNLPINLHPEEIKQSPKHTVSIVLAIAFLVAIIAIAMTRFVPRDETTVRRQSCKNFLQLHSKYPETDDMLWASLIVSVERAVNDPGEPATFIFLYDSSSIGQSLLKDVIHITMECFGNRDAIWRTSNDFKSAETTLDYGVVLDRHREELKSQGVLVVRDLDQVPPNAAKVFFTICDSYEPLVRKAAIFFTIDISQRTNQSQLSPTSIAEGILKDLWRKELHPNVLDPLVVRLTENVFKIDG